MTAHPDHRGGMTSAPLTGPGTRTRRSHRADTSAPVPPAAAGGGELSVSSPIAARSSPQQSRVGTPSHRSQPTGPEAADHRPAVPRAMAGAARGVHLLSTCPQLVEAVEAVCIGVGVPLSVTSGAQRTRATSSELLLVDAALGGDEVPRGAVIVALAEQGDAWDAAARRGASAVVVLPHAAAWLAELISRSTAPEGPIALGRVYGVAGATGGAGATTLACWLAGHFAGDGTRTALVDGDPLGAGLDLALGEETADGLRWPELNQFSGAVAADQLWAAMPRVDSLRYLSWDRRATHTDTVPATTVVAALRGAADVQVVDLSRTELEEQARWCDAVVVVTPRTVRGALAADHTVRRCGPVPVVTALAGLNVADLEARVLAETTGVPCAATIGFDPRVPQHLDDGTVLRRGRRPRHARAVASIAQALGDLS